MQNKDQTEGVKCPYLEDQGGAACENVWAWPGRVAPEDVAWVAVVGGPAPVHVAPAEIGDFNKSIFCWGRMITFHFWKHSVRLGFVGVQSI